MLQTSTQTDKLNNGTLYAPRHEEAFLPDRQKMTSVASLPQPCLITSRDVNEARRPHTCSRPYAFFDEKKRKNSEIPAAPKTHHEIHGSSVTATTSIRRATKHVPRVCPFSPVSIDPRILEIGIVQLSQSVKTTNATQTHTD